MEDEETHDYDLVMPFVVCKGMGGQYEDKDFCAGYALGELSAELKISEQIDAIPRARYLPTPYLKQLDLLAMRFGFTYELDPEKATFFSEDSNWEYITFSTVSKCDHI